MEREVNTHTPYFPQIVLVLGSNHPYFLWFYKWNGLNARRCVQKLMLTTNSSYLEIYTDQNKRCNECMPN